MSAPSYNTFLDLRQLLEQPGHYRVRTRARDPCCLVSGLLVEDDDFSRFRAAHIYPRAHLTEVYLFFLSFESS